MPREENYLKLRWEDYFNVLVNVENKREDIEMKNNTERLVQDIMREEVKTSILRTWRVETLTPI